jgi:hypothetical protein
VETGIASDHLPGVPGCRIALEYDRDLFLQSGKHCLQIKDKGAQLTMPN